MEAMYSVMRNAASMPELKSAGKSRRAKPRQWGATADLQRELRIQRRLILKMTGQMDKASTQPALTIGQRKQQRQLQQEAARGDTVRHNFERHQLRQEIAATLRAKYEAKQTSMSMKMKKTKKTRMKKEKKKKKIQLDKLPVAYRTLHKENRMRILRDQQDQVDRPRIKRQEISQTYLRKSTSTGKINLSSHHGIWQPGNPARNPHHTNTQQINSGGSRGMHDATLPPAYYASERGVMSEEDARAMHALSSYSYLINNKTTSKRHGHASFMAIPGMTSSSGGFDESSSGGSGGSGRASGSNTQRLYQQRVEEEDQTMLQPSKKGMIHPMDAELKELRSRQQRRMPVLLFPDVSGWKQVANDGPLVDSIEKWADYRERLRIMSAAGGGGGDKGRRKKDTLIVQDLLTSAGLGYGEKLYNAAAETADREDLLHTTTFPKGWGTG